MWAPTWFGCFQTGVCIVLFVKDHPALGGFDWLASGYVRNASPELRKGAFHLNLNSNGH